MAGITNCTQNPVGGTLMKTAGGEPTGLLIDSAMKLLLSIIPEVSVDDRRDALVRARRFYFPGAEVKTVWDDLSDLYTSPHNDRVFMMFTDVYQWADSRGQMLIRVCLFFPMETWSRLLAFSDGSLGSYSALFHEVIHKKYLSLFSLAYVFFIVPAKSLHDEPDNYGLQVTPIDSLYNMTLASDKAGLQVALHAIGDRANDMILNLYESVEHAQHLVPGTAARFGEQRIIASVQPDHLLDDADSSGQKLGSERAVTGSYLFGSLLAGNTILAFGSDLPVAKINPLGAIKTAMKRTPPGWEDPWIPSECVSLSDALNAFISWKVCRLCCAFHNSWNELETDISASVEATYIGGIQAYPSLESDI
ncbi:hypothetical protein MKX01_039168 [Papaver californicum]|nr:hypothetical protein MKX01_039168 [Papaver californicum]